jgi:hypothetical protein
MTLANKDYILGFGDYLHELQPSKTWREHLLYVFILCKVHVRRAFRKKFGEHNDLPYLTELFDASSMTELRDIIDEVSQRFLETANWFKNKLPPWILAGINSEASKIPEQWWANAYHHTGISESSHFMDNEAVGRKLSLLSAILG